MVSESTFFLEQIIDQIAVFEAAKGENKEIFPVFINIGQCCDSYNEGYYYSIKLVIEHEQKIPFLPHEDNVFLYKKMQVPQNMVLNAILNIDFETTAKVANEIKEFGRIIRLRMAFFDKLYDYTVNTDKLKFEDWQEKIRKDYHENLFFIFREYKKRNEQQIKFNLENAFTNEVYAFLEKSKTKNNAIDILLGLNLKISNLSYILTLLNPTKFLLYKENVFKLLKMLNLIEEDDSCRSQNNFIGNFIAYLKYNKVLTDVLNNLYNSELQEEKVFFLKASKFIIEFSYQEFLWENCKDIN